MVLDTSSQPHSPTSCPVREEMMLYEIKGSFFPAFPILKFRGALVSPLSSLHPFSVLRVGRAEFVRGLNFTKQNNLATLPQQTGKGSSNKPAVFPTQRLPVPATYQSSKLSHCMTVHKTMPQSHLENVNCVGGSCFWMLCFLGVNAAWFLPCEETEVSETQTVCS